MPSLPERRRKQGQPSRATRPADALTVNKLKKAYQDLEEANRKIRESHIEMILNLAIAAEYKDPDTGNHILRISDYAAEIGKEIGLKGDELEILRYASPMHDIGKIGIPDKILQKPGKLDAEEWETMKQHTVMGWRMFQSSKSPLLKAVAEIALTHHERYDGTGYPYGTKGKDIAIMGRIVAIVDIFDALVSRRCYKSEWSFKETMEHIKTLAGTHLDPELVRVFLKIEERVFQIYNANLTIQQYIADYKEVKDRIE